MLQGKRLTISVIAVLVLTSLLVGCVPVQPQVTEKVVKETVVVETEKVVKETVVVTPTPEPVELEVWWWGGQNLPDYEAYFEKMIARYQETHPNVTITQVLRGTDDVIPAFQGAVEAGQGPDIATLWYGMYFMPDVWAGHALPLDDYVPQEEIDHWIAADWHYWNNHYWQFDQWLEGHPIVYNKQYFEQAGLDPANPPETWDDFLAACESLKQAGIEPIVIGAKDGWIATITQDAFGFQELPNARLNYMEAVLGIRHFTDPEFAYFDKMYELYTKGYFNDDVSSLGVYDGRMAFPAERGAMNFPSLPTAMEWIQTMGSDKVGFMPPPRTTQPVAMAVDMEGLFLPTFSEHPQEAADFLAYLHSEEALKTFVEDIGYAYVPDDRFDLDWVEDPEIRRGLEMGKEGIEKNARMVESLIPYSIFSDGYFPALQRMFSEGLEPAAAAQMVEQAAEDWRQLNPEQVAQYQLWYEQTKLAQ